MLFSIVWALPALADDFDPEPPADPNALYKVVTRATPPCVASGGSSYQEGNIAYISTSGEWSYKFSHWTKNGEWYTDELSFEYVVEPVGKTIFEAVWEYNPDIPADPNASNGYRLFLETNEPDACSFNISSGSKCEFEEWIYLEANISPGYDFGGWYCGNEKITDELNFQYLMPAHNVTLTTRLIFNPVTPGDPSPVLLGDVNGDNKVTVADAVAVIDYYLHWTESSDEDKKYDVNKDNKVTVADAVEAINIYLNAK